MKKKHLQPLTPAALYARVSSDRQDVDLSVSAQMRALLRRDRRGTGMLRAGVVQLTGDSACVRAFFVV